MNSTTATVAIAVPSALDPNLWAAAPARDLARAVNLQALAANATFFGRGA
jgi:hypothetical protein